jgi:hypothetical protein
MEISLLKIFKRRLTKLRIIIIVLFLTGFASGSKAMNVALIGSNNNANIVTYLTSYGFTVTDFGGTIPSAATLSSYQAAVLLRMDGNSTLASWVSNGGLLITEWSAASWAAGNVLANVSSASAGSIGSGTAVTFSASTLGVKLRGTLTNPYSDGGATEFFYTFSNIGAGVEILATRPTNIAAIVGGASGSGYAFIIGYDWADGFPSTDSNNGTMLRNALNSGATGQQAPANPSTVTASYNPVCNGASTQLTAGNAVGTVYWYTGSCGGTQVATGNPLTVSPTTNTTYYARNYSGGIYSSGCASITIAVSPKPTVADLQATGTNVKWYLTLTGGSALASTTLLTTNTHYYASQTVNGVESSARMDVLVTMTNP